MLYFFDSAEAGPTIDGSGIRLFVS